MEGMSATQCFTQSHTPENETRTSGLTCFILIERTGSFYKVLMFFNAFCDSKDLYLATTRK